MYRSNESSMWQWEPVPDDAPPVVRLRIFVERFRIASTRHSDFWALRKVADTQPGMTVAELRRILAPPTEPKEG